MRESSWSSTDDGNPGAVAPPQSMKTLLLAMTETGGSAILTLVLGVISIKIMAVTLGPAGTGLYNFLLQILAVSITLATLNGAQAVVQAVSSRGDSARICFIESSARVVLLGFMIISLGLISLAHQISSLVGDVPPQLIRLLVVPLGMSTLYVYLSALFNGFLMVRTVAAVRVVGSLGTAVMVYPLALGARHTPYGYLLLICTSVVVQAALSLIVARRNRIPLPLVTRHRHSFRWSEARSFMIVATSLLSVGLMGNAALLILNTAIVRHLGLAAGGVFNAAWNLSMQYVLLVLTSLSTYYLPALARLKGSPDGSVLLARVARVIAIVAPIIIVVMVVMKPLIVSVLYSPEYGAAVPLIRWMLIGDFFKIMAWVVAMPALAHADMKTFFWTEFGWFVLFTGLALVSILRFGSLQGIGLAFVGSYAPYFGYYLLYVRRRYAFQFAWPLVRSWLLGFTVIALASFATWTDVRVSYISLLWVVGAFLVASASVSRAEAALLARRLIPRAFRP